MALPGVQIIKYRTQLQVFFSLFLLFYSLFFLFSPFFSLPFFSLFFLRVALTGPRSVAINRLHPCSHWPLFAIAPTHEWIGNGANQVTVTVIILFCTLTYNHTRARGREQFTVTQNFIPFTLEALHTKYLLFLFVYYL